MASRNDIVLQRRAEGPKQKGIREPAQDVREAAF